MLGTIYPSAKQAMSGVDSLNLALREAENAVDQISEGKNLVELSPQSAYIRRLQHLIAQRSNLVSTSSGQEPNRRVRIFQE
jgi:predicted RNA-binding protein Jag